MEIHEVILKVRQVRRDNLMKGFVNCAPLGLREGDENPFEKAAADEPETDIEKSDIMNAFSNTDMVMIKKTGKEIKDQITNTVLPMLTTELSEAKAKADALLQNCGTAPTRTVKPWWTGDIKMDVPYKVYDWSECCFYGNQQGIQPTLSAEGYADAKQMEADKNGAANKEEAVCREQYNDAVRVVCEILVDQKAADIMLNNLKDDQQITLNPRQAATLHFK